MSVNYAYLKKKLLSSLSFIVYIIIALVIVYYTTEYVYEMYLNAFGNFDEQSLRSSGDYNNFDRNFILILLFCIVGFTSGSIVIYQSLITGTNGFNYTGEFYDEGVSSILGLWTLVFLVVSSLSYTFYLNEAGRLDVRPNHIRAYNELVIAYDEKIIEAEEYLEVGLEEDSATAIPKLITSSVLFEEGYNIISTTSEIERIPEFIYNSNSDLKEFSHIGKQIAETKILIFRNSDKKDKYLIKLESLNKQFQDYKITVKNYVMKWYSFTYSISTYIHEPQI